LDSCGFLGASPDGLLGDAVIEVKCPYTYRKDDINKAVKDNKSYFVWNDAKKRIVNVDHPYYDQIMGQMVFTGRKKCYFKVWTTVNYVVIRISYNEKWTANVPLLRKFYVEHFIP